MGLNSLAVESSTGSSVITLRETEAELMTRSTYRPSPSNSSGPIPTGGQATDPLLARVKRGGRRYLETLQELVGISMGSHDIEGLNHIAEVIGGRLRAMGGEVEFVAPGCRSSSTTRQAPISHMVLGRFKGSGARRVLLLAHMDTVYGRGIGAKQPFRVDGDRTTASASPTTSRASR